MIDYAQGNVLEARVEALVNTVNTVGVMGKGVALQFRHAFPENYTFYQKACKRGDVQPGKMLVFETGRFTEPRYVVNFPTKRHWKEKSRLEYIDSGLHDLVNVVKVKHIRSIAIPALGCGNGGLDWDDVRPRIVAAFDDLPEVHVLLYAPAGSPDPETMQIATSRPNLTPGRAAMIALMHLYALPGYRLSMLEIQKLAYFLQVAGQPLRLSFTRGRYGPYAETLHHVLQRIEGHYIRGYGDRSQAASMYLLAGADKEAQDYLHEHPDVDQRLQRVAHLIEGFETPYGLELLATVHWLASDTPDVACDSDVAIQAVHGWNERKKKMFQPEHIRIAWNRLQEQGWLSGAFVSCA